MMNRTFEERWEELRPGNGESVFKRVDEMHPLDFYIGLDITGERMLLLLTDYEPPSVPKGQSIEVSSAKRQDGKWTLLFRLVRPELGKVFSQLCEDLVETSRDCNDMKSGTSIVIARFLRWKKLLERGNTGLMDEKALRGLIGELLFLETVIPRYGIEISIESWSGPLGADQDFRFPDFWYEVKTIRPGASSITISSVEQLDVKGYCGELVVLYLDRATGSEPGSFTPSDLVQRLKGVIESNLVASIKFEDKLLEAGYIERKEYNQQFFVLKEIRRFAVTEGFPKLCRRNLPYGIKNVKYEVEISSLEVFEQ
jgi:hypothetical protein